MRKNTAVFFRRNLLRRRGKKITGIRLVLRFSALLFSTTLARFVFSKMSAYFTFSHFSHFSTQRPIWWKIRRIFTILLCFIQQTLPLFQAGCVLQKGIFRLFTVFTFFHPEADLVENSPYINGLNRIFLYFSAFSVESVRIFSSHHTMGRTTRLREGKGKSAR